VVPHLVTARLMLTVVVTAAMALSWFGLAVHAAMHAGVYPWARRAAPLYLGMGLAETLRGLDHGLASVWTFAGVLLCAAVAVLAARLALLDLNGAVRAEEAHLADLTAALDRASDEAGGLSVWREQLTHDAQNACAGLRAAMEILEKSDGKVDPRVTERLRLSAIQEIGHIEHLLTRSSNQPCRAFDVTEVVHAVGDAARSLGADVTVHGTDVRGHGRAADLAAALKNILVNAQTHAPGSRVDIWVTTTDNDIVTIACSDDGPGFDSDDTAHVFERGYRRNNSPGSGLGLYAARELVREQGGDLRLGPAHSGATFLITLPAVSASAVSADMIRVPAQRALHLTSSDRAS
jgi:signal transduction histidine kinase